MGQKNHAKVCHGDMPIRVTYRSDMRQPTSNGRRSCSNESGDSDNSTLSVDPWKTRHKPNTETIVVRRLTESRTLPPSRSRRVGSNKRFSAKRIRHSATPIVYKTSDEDDSSVLLDDTRWSNDIVYHDTEVAHTSADREQGPSNAILGILFWAFSCSGTGDVNSVSFIFC